MSSEPKEEVVIIPAKNTVNAEPVNGAIAREQAQEISQFQTQKVSKVARYGLIGIITLVVLLLIFGVCRLLTASSSVTDANGCIWDELSPLKVQQYQRDATKDYPIKSENGKTYLLRECKQ